MGTIAGRVRDALTHAGRKQNETASAVGMTADGLSRALNGQRGFGAVELADLARFLQVDVHWLITGEQDPYRLAVSARHAFDHESGERSVSGAIPDQEVLERIALVYEQAALDDATTLPANIAELRNALSDNFVTMFADELEKIGVDVVRVEQLSTAYSFTLADRAVIALNSSGNWFHQNWSLAHELGHLVGGHTCVMPGNAQGDALELQANQFAAELLLPENAIRAIDWSSATAEQLAAFLWVHGVSTATLRYRLIKLGQTVSPILSSCLEKTTQTVLRRHYSSLSEGGRDLITERMQHASRRRFPERLLTAHIDGIAEGRLHRGSLAWMLDIDEAEIELGESAPAALLSGDELTDLLG